MDKKLVKALNEQIKNEIYSSHLYLAMAAYCSNRNLPGFAHWMNLQAKEEMGHAMKIFGFLLERGEKAVVLAIPQPPEDFASPKAVFEATLQHEKKVTAMIDKLYNQAKQVKDSATEIFLQWFVTEQVEEEASASGILEDLKIVKSDSPALIMVDRGLAKRGAH